MSIRTLRVLCTPRCNLNCSYCCREGYAFQKTVCTPKNLADFCAAVDSRVGLERVKFTGGEPLLCENLFEMVEAVGDLRKFKLSVVTNGTHPAKIAELISVTREIQVAVSLPAWTRAEYNRATGTKGFLPQVKASLKYLTSKEIAVRLNVVVRKESSVQGLRHLVEKSRIDEWDFRAIEMTRNSLNRKAVSAKDIPSLYSIQKRFNSLGYYQTRDSASTTLFTNHNRDHSFELTKAFCRDGCTRCPQDKSCIWLAADGTVRTCAWGNKPDYRIDTWTMSELDSVTHALENDLRLP